eukprot:gene11051-12217_t
MHRAYQPITPANNKLLKKRWDTTRFHFHRKKVCQAAAVIDNRPPKTYMHLHLKLKNLQIEEERLAEVERDNRILLEKMSYIMRTRGSVDNRNYYQHKSLNKTKRQRELLRLTHENQAILKRITSKEPHYNHREWEEDWTIKQRYMDNIAKYPKYWHKKTKQELAPLPPRTSSKGKKKRDSKDSSAASKDNEDEANVSKEEANEYANEDHEKTNDVEEEAVADDETKKTDETEEETKEKVVDEESA